MNDNLLNISHSIETDKTVLRQYSEGDGKLFFDLIHKNKDRLADSFPSILANAFNEITTEYFIQNKIIEWYEKKSFAFGIWLKGSGEYIGHLNVKNIDWVIPRAELAYFISGEYEGRGIMKEVLTALVKFCFEELEMNRIFVRVLTGNERSYKLAERCGFTKEGTMRKDHRTFDGDLVDLFYYGLTIDDYRLLKEKDRIAG